MLFQEEGLRKSATNNDVIRSSDAMPMTKAKRNLIHYG